MASRSELGPAGGIAVSMAPLAGAAAPGGELSAAEVDRRVEGAVRRHLPLVWRVLRRAGLPAADSDDAAQDVFWVLLKRIADVPEAAERSFLISTALRLASDRRRSKWRRCVTEPLDSEAWPAHELLADEALAIRQGRALLDEALAALAPAERSVFVLVELEQLTREEAAQVLEMPAGTVASRLRRAREVFAVAAKKLSLRARRPA